MGHAIPFCYKMLQEGEEQKQTHPHESHGQKTSGSTRICTQLRMDSGHACATVKCRSKFPTYSYTLTFDAPRQMCMPTRGVTQQP